MALTVVPAAREPITDDPDPWGLSALARITCPWRGRTLHLGRAWPRSAGHLLLEYRDGDSTVAGQWFADPHRLRAVAGQTAEVAPGQVTVLEESGVMLQAEGADRRLLALAELVGEPGSELVVHRPERRAVVRLRRGGSTTYRKVTRPGRRAHLPGGVELGAVRVPAIVTHDVATGILELAELPGRSLHELLGDVEVSEGEIVTAFRAAGEALAVLHAAEPGSGLARHDVVAEWEVAERWVAHALGHGVVHADAVGPAAALADLRTRLDRREGKVRTTLVHRDLHDKQMLVADGDEVGVLDLDTLALGDPALDLANLLVHLELRVLQGWCDPGRATAAASALLEGYRPPRSLRDGLDAYAAATRLRLACLYSFRPRWRSLAVRLLSVPGAV